MVLIYLLALYGLLSFVLDRKKACRGDEYG